MGVLCRSYLLYWEIFTTLTCSHTVKFCAQKIPLFDDSDKTTQSLFLFQPTNVQIYIYISHNTIFYIKCSLLHVSYITPHRPPLNTRHTSTITITTKACICSHKNTLLTQDITTSHRIYCITQRRSNNILIYFNLRNSNSMKL